MASEWFDFNTIRDKPERRWITYYPLNIYKFFAHTDPSNMLMELRLGTIEEREVIKQYRDSLALATSKLDEYLSQTSAAESRAEPEWTVVTRKRNAKDLHSASSS